ncbi:MAG: hypothetical protein L6Q84_08655 [Polyangiaceae bacterium]|nr:hypothetical protein [Polyangiaceae bacterium]
MLQGSFVIHNALDVQSIAAYGQITGALQINAPGLSSISLPSLCSVGAEVDEQDAPDLVTLDLPALTSAGGISVNGAPLKTVHLEKLTTVANSLSLSIDGSLNLASLQSTGDFFISGKPSQIDAPKLTTVSQFSVSCNPPATCGSVSANALLSAQEFVLVGIVKVTAHNLTTVVALIVNTGGQVDLPALKNTTGTNPQWPFSFWFKGDSTTTFPALTSVAGDFLLVTAAPSMSFPKLTSLGGSVQIQGTGSGQSVSFPVLSSLDGNGASVSIDVPGAFSAPAVVTAKNGLKIRSVSNLDLSALQSVGPAGTATPCAMDSTGKPGWSPVFDLDASTIATLQLPALKSACLLFGDPAGNPVLCKSGNVSLSKIVAPNLTKGGVQFFNNPSLSKCRADALAAQIPSPVPYGLTGFEHCPLASGPCP